MTTYSTEFDGYTLDAQPSGWTARWTTTNSSWAVRNDAASGASRRLEHTSSADAWRLLSWDTVDADANRANVEILSRVRVQSVAPTAIYNAALIARASGAAGSDSAYMVVFSATSGGAIRLMKRVAGVSTFLGTQYDMPAQQQVGVWYYIRFRVNGSNLYAKIWKDGDPEPADWQTTATDTSVTGAGWVGVGNFESTGTTRDFDFVSIGTNGDTAPLVPLTSTNIRVSAATIETMLEPAPNGIVSSVVMEVAMGQEVPGFIHQAVIEVMMDASLPDPGDVVQQPWPMMIC